MKVLPKASNAIMVESDKYGNSILQIHQFNKRFSITMYQKDQLEENGEISNRSMSAGGIYLYIEDGIMMVEMGHGVQHTVTKI